MFTSLNDRLKAAVAAAEASGSNLHAKAIASTQAPAAGSSTSRPSSPNVAIKSAVNTAAATGESPQASPKLERPGQAGPTSPTTTSRNSSTMLHGGHYVASTSALAENALNGLTGLRKSFNFGRPSLDGQRPQMPTSPSTAEDGPAQQELKDIPHPRSPAHGSTSASTTLNLNATAISSRPASPAPHIRGHQFALGSDPSSFNATPQIPRSPSPSARLPRLLPRPDPSDPATFPLPPSPVAEVSSLPQARLTPSTAGFADPLGASPLLDGAGNGGGANDETEVPSFGLEEPTPIEEKGEGEVSIGLGLGLSTSDGQAGQAGDTEAAASDPLPSALANGTLKENHEPTSIDAEEAGQSYQDLNKKYSTLLTLKQNADRALKELTPLEGGIEDDGALEGWVRMMNGKVEMITEEMKRLQAKITLQDSRMEELRDTHRLESSSQTELVTKLRSQLSTAESNLASKSADLLILSTLRTDLTKAQTQAKEEEEKRTKAISLLKTVRMKLVKVEKEKEEVERDRAEERAERSSAREEVEKVRAEREREVGNLRKGFERELNGAKERFEKEMKEKKAAWELEMITTKAAHAKDISAKSTKIAGLESIVKELNITKQQQFEGLQSRQAEVESSRAEMENMQARTKELEFQLREATERCALLEDAASSSKSSDRGRSHLGVGLPASRDVSPASRFPSTSTPVDVQRLLAEADARAESKLSDLRHKVRALETERNELEEEWAAKLSERVRECEKLRRGLTEKEGEYADSIRLRRDKERLIEEVEETKRALEREMRTLRSEVEEAKADVAVAAEAERAAREEIATLQSQISTLQSQLEDAKNHAATLKQSNKTLRDEMRKVQSSVQLLEKQRNPGVGYWAAGANGPSGTAGSSRSALMSPDGSGPATPSKERRSLESGRESVMTGRGSITGASSPAPSEATTKNEEEEVNLEYLRNVILQFLEHKEMRPNLVRVLSVILRFTPQELRRLNAKLLS